MKGMSVLAVLGWLGAARAQAGPEAPSGTDPAVREPPPAASAASAPTMETADRRLQLRDAVQRYQLGEFESALASLAELVVAPDISESLRREARVYMAELLLTQGDREGAELFFRKVLSEDRTLELDPFRHPPDVMGFFQYVKAKLDAEAPPSPSSVPTVMELPSPPVRAPWTTAMPFGAYHFSQGRPLGGTAWFVAHAGLVGTSAVTLSLLLSDNGAPAELTRYDDYLAVRRTNWVSSGLAVAALAGYYVDVGLHWKREKARRRPASVGLAPTSGGALATSSFVF